MATMLAVPPIQLPERAANPFQASGGRKPSKRKKAIGPPSNTPTVPVNIMLNAIQPSLSTAGRSRVIIRRKSEKGRRTVDIQPYNGFWEGVMPAVVRNIGTK